MSGTEKEKPSRRKKDVDTKNEADTNDATDVRANLRNLVMSAGSALGDLLNDSEPKAAAETEAVAESVSVSEAEVASEAEAVEMQEEPVAEAPAKKSRGKKKNKKKQEPELEHELVSSIDWNESTENLDFVESKGETDAVAAAETEAVAETESEAVAESEAVSDTDTDTDTDGENAFEMLARRIAETASKNEIETDSEAQIEAASETETETATDSNPNAEEAPQMGFAAMEQELTAAENDADPQPVEFIEQDQLLSILESLLFSTDKPVSVSTMKQLFKGSNIRSKDITRALDLLASDYASSVRGVSLEEINGGYQLRTKSDNAEYLRRLAKVRPFRLSGPALEVMAIVAYKQPITKHEIDEIRGVESGHLLRALMERGLICFGEKSELPGKPMTYGTTRKFLETFGLRNIRELPTLSEIDDLLPEGIGEVEEKETLSDITDSMSHEITTTYSEGEDELLKINEQLQAVDTTSEFFEQEKQRERERKDREKAQDIRERLVMGEEVETKDRRWLDRYEAKLHTQQTPDSASAAPEPIGDQLEALTAESEATGEEASTEAAGAESVEESSHEEEMLAEDDIDADDLTGNIDWDEDEASDKEV